MKTIDKTIRSCDADFIIPSGISDTWRFIDNYGSRYVKTSEVVQIDMNEAVKNSVDKGYINRLLK